MSYCLECKHVDRSKGLACMTLAYGWVRCAKGYAPKNFGANLPTFLSHQCGMFEPATPEERESLAVLIERCKRHLQRRLADALKKR